MTETEEEFEKRKKQIEANEKFASNVKAGKANPVSKNTEGIVVSTLWLTSPLILYSSFLTHVLPIYTL